MTEPLDPVFVPPADEQGPPTVTLYDEATGRLLAHVSSSSEEVIALQVQPGQAIYRGKLDLRRQCIDKHTREPKPFAPPDPQDGSVWEPDEHRWKPLAEQNFATLLSIEDAERKQHRVVRETLLAIVQKVNGLDPQLIARLQDINSAAAAERTKIKKRPGGG